MYQVVAISPFQIEVHNTTLETCTDVVYDGMNDVISEYGKLLTGRTIYDHEVRDYSKFYTPAIRLDNVINEVHRIFDNNPKVKTVHIDFSFTPDEFYGESYERDLQRENADTFKPAGLMYSSKLDCFKKWKAPNASGKVKPKKVPKKLLQILRELTVRLLNNRIQEEHGILLNISGSLSILYQTNIVKFCKKLGYNYKKVLELKGVNELWSVTGHTVSSNVLGCIDQYCKEYDMMDMKEQCIAAYKEWFETE